MGRTFHIVRGASLPAAAPILGRQKGERLVGMGFRRMVHAVQSGERLAWELQRQEFACVAGDCRASELLQALEGYAETVLRCAARHIETLPQNCPGFCRDECLAVSIVAASQHGACPALKACAFALLASNHIEEPLAAAQSFAGCLAGAGQQLSADTIVNALPAIPGASTRVC